jgi:hypothetical protein
VIVKINSVEALAPVHRKQLLTYLRLADKGLGLPINFHAAPIKDAIARIINGLEEESHAKSQRRQENQWNYQVWRLAGLKSKTSLDRQPLFWRYGGVLPRRARSSWRLIRQSCGRWTGHLAAIRLY